jgi:hypothetical protein
MTSSAGVGERFESDLILTRYNVLCISHAVEVRISGADNRSGRTPGSMLMRGREPSHACQTNDLNKNVRAIPAGHGDALVSALSEPASRVALRCVFAFQESANRHWGFLPAALGFSCRGTGEFSPRRWELGA